LSREELVQPVRDVVDLVRQLMKCGIAASNSFLSGAALLRTLFHSSVLSASCSARRRPLVLPPRGRSGRVLAPRWARVDIAPFRGLCRVAIVMPGQGCRSGRDFHRFGGAGGRGQVGWSAVGSLPSGG